MTVRDMADTDPGGHPILDECPTEEECLPPAGPADEAWPQQLEELATWRIPPPEPELTEEQLKKELAEHNRLMLGLGLTRLNKRQRKELVEARHSEGRAFVAYSGLGTPPVRTNIDGTADAPTVLLKRRRRIPWRSGVVVVCVAIATLGVFGTTWLSRPSSIPAESVPRPVAGAAHALTVALGREGTESPPTDQRGPLKAPSISAGPVASARRAVDPPTPSVSAPQPSRPRPTSTNASSKPWLVVPEI